MVKIQGPYKNLEMIEKTWPVLSRSTRKISDLIQDMLTYSKERKLDLESRDVNRVVREMVDLCSRTAEEQDVELRLELCDESPQCMIDEEAFQDAVLNLIGNAIEAVSEVGKGWVRVCTRLVSDKKEVELSVEDNGCGIPEEVVNKIFEPFFSTKGSRGTGLGLAVTKKVIDEHGGHISVTSTRW